MTCVLKGQATRRAKAAGKARSFSASALEMSFFSSLFVSSLVGPHEFSCGLPSLRVGLWVLRASVALLESLGWPLQRRVPDGFPCSLVFWLRSKTTTPQRNQELDKRRIPIAGCLPSLLSAAVAASAPTPGRLWSRARHPRISRALESSWRSLPHHPC